MTELKLQKPFLKWVGGKTQIINDIISKIPKEVNNYHELFLGGGSVLLAVLSLQKQNKIVIKNKIYAYDINSELINVYKHIQNNKDELYKIINLYIKEYDSIEQLSIFVSSEYQELKTKNKNKKLKLNDEEIGQLNEYKKKEKTYRNPVNIEQAKSSKESYYYWIRNKYINIEKNSIECSALFMFINKTCFRGMYREGPNGFNIPFGNYKKTPTIISETDLNYISDLIKDVEFKQSSFVESIKDIKHGDFVYLDPPYAPENDNSFVGYVADGFGLEKHKLLFNEIKKLDKIKFVMSNSKVELVTDNFKDYNCEDIIARRAINAKKPGSTTTEVIIYN
jgi:DNA adenine methylase